MSDYEKDLATNRKARHQYHLLERFEAGIVLTGTEVKSVRVGRVNLKDGYARVRDGYLALAESEPERFAIIDATQSLEQVQAAIGENLTRLIDEK